MLKNQSKGTIKTVQLKRLPVDQQTFVNGFDAKLELDALPSSVLDWLVGGEITDLLWDDDGMCQLQEIYPLAVRHQLRNTQVTITHQIDAAGGKLETDRLKFRGDIRNIKCVPIPKGKFRMEAALIAALGEESADTLADLLDLPVTIKLETMQFEMDLEPGGLGSE